MWGNVPVPRELTLGGIQEIVHDYARAAKNAIEAGMDGVEIHAGNGYLLDQFINSSSNHGTDQYGGSSENRARLLIEVTDAVSEAVGSHRVGVRLTPMGRFMGMGDETPERTFGYIGERLNGRKLAYHHLVEPSVVGTTLDEHYDPRWDEIMASLRAKFEGIVIVAGGYDLEKAKHATDSGRADLIAFGRSFIANPNLPKRFVEGSALTIPDPATFFGGDTRGYTDYPNA